jgi:hypothetical protein
VEDIVAEARTELDEEMAASEAAAAAAAAGGEDEAAPREREAPETAGDAGRDGDR